MTDTSAEAVERLAAFHALSVQRYDADEESGLRACAHMTAATLRALLAERDALQERAKAAEWVCQGMARSAEHESAIRKRAEAERDRLREALRVIIVNASRKDATAATLLDGCDMIARAALKEGAP